MTKKIFMLIMIVGLSENVWGFEKWTTTDYIMEAAFLTLLAVDWSQTISISNDERYHEHNPVLGRHPSRGRVNIWFPVAGAAHIGIAHVLDHPHRNWWQGSGIILELGCVGNNLHCGIRLSL